MTDNNQKKTILVVDDSATARKIIRHELEQGGYQVEEAQNGFEALAKVISLRQPPDLITMDIEMPSLNGFEASKKLREEGYTKLFTQYTDGQVPIIFITARDTLEGRATGFQLGAIDFIPKPFNRGGILSAANKILYPPQDKKDFTILLADDNPVVLKIVEAALLRQGYRVLTVDDGLKALTMATKNPGKIDMVITDYMMPKMKGDELCRELRQIETLKHVPIIFLSAVPEKEKILSMFRAGAYDYLMKPFLAEELIARVKVHADMRDVVKQLEQQKSMLYAQNKALAEMSIRDSLTKLYNHRYIIERAQQQIDLDKRNNHQTSILMFDLDYFKKVNDQYGHQFGDKVLVEISRATMESLRAIDLIGRYGGEEFLVILPETSLEGGRISAQRIAEAIDKIKWEHAGFTVNISGGLATWQGGSAIDLIAKADALLYQAKKNGRNRIEYA